MTTINVTELSEKLGTTGRTARKFLRSITPVEEQPGKGGRWSIEKAQVRTLTKKFQTWQDEHTRPVEAPDGEEPEGRDDTEELETE